MSYDWQPYNNNVQQNMQDGKFINASFALMAAGPPTFDALGAKPEANLESLPVVPIGLVQNLAVSHNRVFSRVFEVGSERSMFIPGRTVGQATLGRVFMTTGLCSVSCTPGMRTREASTSSPISSRLTATTSCRTHTRTRTTT